MGNDVIFIFFLPPSERIEIEEEGQQRRSSAVSGSCKFTPDDNRYGSHSGVVC